MKRLIISSLFAVFALNIYAQIDTIVSKIQSKKKVVIEEFTGIGCQYCPLGHKKAEDLMEANPDKVFAIAVHQASSYSVGPPNYQTSFGPALNTQAQPSGYPSGTVNRHIFSGTTMGMNPDAVWASATSTILGENSPVNIAIETYLDHTTRQLKIHLQWYYTENSTKAKNKLNVALLQNKIIGPQSGGSTHNPAYATPDGKYIHMHMLRHLITGQWGIDITNTTKGSFKDTTIIYNVPLYLGSGNIPVELKNIEIVAFIAEDNTEILTAAGAFVPAANTPVAECSISAWDAGVIPIGNDFISKNITLKNIGSDTLKIISITGISEPFFANIDPTTIKLKFNQTSNFTLKYSPTSIETTNQTMVINTNGGDISINLSGKGHDCSSEFISAIPWNADFESGTISPCWTLIDADGDNRKWFIDPAVKGYGGIGKCVSSESFVNYVGPIKPDNYLVLPKITALDNNIVLTYFVAAQDSAFPTEKYQVVVSKTGNAIENFTIVLHEETMTATGSKGLQGEWKKRSMVLPEGTKYIAFRHFESFNKYRINIDEISLSIAQTTPQAVCTPLEWNAGKIVAGDTVTSANFKLQNIGEGNLKCISITGISEPFSCSLIPDEIDIAIGEAKTFTFTYTPIVGNKTTQIVNIATSGGDIIIKLEGEAANCAEIISVFPWAETFEMFPGCWTLIDADGDGHNWIQSALPNIGNLGAVSISSLGNSSIGWTPLTPDNYLISQEINGAKNVSYKIGSFGGIGWTKDHYAVCASSTGTNIADFSILFEETLESDAAEKMTNRSVNLPAGTKHIAFRHFNSKDIFAIIIDDVTLSDIESPVAINENDNKIAIYPNPASNILNISAYNVEYVEYVEIYNIVGKKVISVYNQNTIDISNLAKGTYIAIITTNSNVLTQKINIAR